MQVNEDKKIKNNSGQSQGQSGNAGQSRDDKGRFTQDQSVSKGGATRRDYDEEEDLLPE